MTARSKYNQTGKGNIRRFWMHAVPSAPRTQCAHKVRRLLMTSTPRDRNQTQPFSDRSCVKGCCQPIT